MSKEEDKIKRSSRLHKEEVAIKKQVRIAKDHGVPHNNDAIKQPHRLAKHHALDCGQPGCILCSSPRKIFKEETVQEKSFKQRKLHDEE